jgi:hypothetical protein
VDCQLASSAKLLQLLQPIPRGLMLEPLDILIGCLALLSGAYPLWRGWRTLADSSLRHALLWCVAAWAGWLAAGFMPLLNAPAPPVRYLALSLSTCAALAVFGARHPGMAAWNFVVAGLLAILLLPLLEQPWDAADWQLDLPRALFLGGILSVGLGNYVPTRMGLPAMLLAAVFGFDLWHLMHPRAYLPQQLASSGSTQAALALALWGLHGTGRDRGVDPAEPDVVWRTFRDRYGAIWSLRVLEQFNHAARHAGWPVWLSWQGVRVEPNQPPPSPAQTDDIRRTLRGLLKRFGPAESGTCVTD